MWFVEKSVMVEMGEIGSFLCGGKLDDGRGGSLVHSSIVEYVTICGEGDGGGGGAIGG